MSFQSYYSLISNCKFLTPLAILVNFNPIIVLFLTGHWFFDTFLTDLFQSYYSLISNHPSSTRSSTCCWWFQSYYSLISNMVVALFIIHCIRNFNPIIVLFLTFERRLEEYIQVYFNPIIVLFLTTHIPHTFLLIVRISILL